MTTAADDAAVEGAFEAYLAGRPVSGAAADTFPGLAAFSEAVRASATLPGRPNAALAELLTTGSLTDQSTPSARTATSAASPTARRSARVRIRRRTAMIFPALLTKFLSAGAIAQAATGAGVAVVVVTGAGAAGVLPDPLQNTVSTVVETVTPFKVTTGEEPVTDEPVDEVTAEPVDEAPVDEAPDADKTHVEESDVEESTTGPTAEEPAEAVAFNAEAWAAKGPDAYPSFGAWVSDGARHGAFKGEGSRFGQTVSAHARNKGLDAQELEAEGVDVDELTDDSATEPAPEAETEDADEQTTKPGKTKGDGKGNGGKGRGEESGKGAGKGAGKGGGRN